MNEQYNTTPSAASAAGGTKPPVITQLIIAVIAAAAAGLFAEFMAVSALILAAGTVYIMSSRAPVPIVLLPIIGVAVAVLRGGVLLGGVAATVMAAGLIAGWILRTGGNFQSALMLASFFSLAVALAGAAWIMKSRGITVESLSQAFETHFTEAFEVAIASFGDRLSADAAAALRGQAPAVAQSCFVYAPSIIGMAIETVGILAIRFAGLLHDMTGSTVYRESQRIAVVSRVFAVVYLVSVLAASMAGGVVGASAGNVMMILMLPAAAAGVSSYRLMLRERRAQGRRGLPLSFALLVFTFIFFSPVMGIMVLSFTGTIAAFRKKR